MRPNVNPQRAMTRTEFSVHVFVAIIIAALASVASSVSSDRGYANSTDFKIVWTPITSDFYDVTIICHSNDWTKWPDVNLNLSSDAKVYFRHCAFPPELEVQSILHSMGLPVMAKTEFINLKGMLNRKNLKGLSTSEFHLVDSNFKGSPFDLMYDVMNVRLFVSYDNKLKNIPDSFFGDWAVNLTHVIIRINKLRKIKRNNFIRLVNLTTLDLAHNKIIEIEPAAFDKLVLLESIDLSFNRLRTLPVGLFQQTNTLNLAHNLIEQIEPAAFDELVNLQSIDLSFNRLRTLPIGVFQRHISLKSIDLSSNCLDELAQDLLANCKLLEEFSMNGNNGTLSTLPDMFFGNLSSLQVASLIDSQLESLPSNLFAGCSKVTSISLNENKLTTLPSSLFNDTRELQYLRISENRLETLPPHIFSKLNRLERLFLDSNRLTSLMPEVLEGLQSVLEFDASHNNITRIDDQFLHFLKSAHLIDLSHNQLTFESHQHKVMPQDLEESSLINTPKNEDKPVVINGIPIYARHLELKFNNIKELNADVIQFLKYVHYLDLSGNLISQINLSVLPVEDMRWNITLDNGKVETRYKSITLDWNPFHCDCNMKDFIEQLNGENGTELSEMLPSSHICASPPEVKGRYMQLIGPDELNCPTLNTSDQARVQKIE